MKLFNVKAAINTAAAQTPINFLKIGLTSLNFSILLILLSILCIILRNFHWGIDFTGGMSLELRTSKICNISNIRKVLKQNAIANPIIQHAGSNYDFQLCLPLKSEQDLATSAEKIILLLRQNIDDKITAQRTSFVSPDIGVKLAQTGYAAIIFALLAILIYIGLRFEWRLAISAILALMHDVIITCGALSLLQIEIDFTIIAAILSVVGYSLNDTIVVFDRIRENFLKTLNDDTVWIINLSLTQTLNRTLITSATTLLVLLALFLLGGPLLYGFALVLIIGIIVGTFSSIYIASALALKFNLKHNLFQTR